MDPISVLYHSSPRDLQQIVPQEAFCRLRDQPPPPPPYVYAQPDLVVAHAYALKDKGRPSAIGRDPGTGICRMIVTSEETPWDRDLPRQDGRPGGFIYGLKPRDFHQVRDRGEWVSGSTQTPVSKKFVTTDDALSKGVQILVLSGQNGYRVDDLWRVFATGEVETFLAVGLEKGAVSWLNKERGLHPSWPIDDTKRKVVNNPERPLRFSHDKACNHSVARQSPI